MVQEWPLEDSRRFVGGREDQRVPGAGFRLSAAVEATRPLEG